MINRFMISNFYLYGYNCKCRIVFGLSEFRAVAPVGFWVLEEIDKMFWLLC